MSVMVEDFGKVCRSYLIMDLQICGGKMKCGGTHPTNTRAGVVLPQREKVEAM